MTDPQDPSQINDGYCPTCCALDTEACHRPDGSARPDHKRRHQYPLEVSVIVNGHETLLNVDSRWDTLTALITAARWQAGCGHVTPENFEARDAQGTLLKEELPLSVWMDWLRMNRRIFVNLKAGIGA